MPSLHSNLFAALNSLKDQKQRAMLSATGILVAAAAIVLLISVARGVERDVDRQITDLGVNLLVVIPGRISGDSLFSPNLMGLSYLRDEDVSRVRKVPGVLRAAPLMFVGGGIHQGARESQSTMIIAAGADWFHVHPSTLAQGKFYTEGQSHERVCVIGSIAKENLFGSSQALGRPITINGANYRVVGVTQDQKAEDSLFSMGGFENIAYIPYELARDTLPSPQINRIMIQTAPDREPKTLVAAVRNELAKRLSSDQFSVLTQEDLMKVFYQILGILTGLLASLTSIALVVGGMGIMTVMLMSVSERAKEIGVRKTVGARQSDIFQQFLLEAVFLTVIGGMAGCGVSDFICMLIARFTKVKPLVSWDVIVLGIGVSVVVGVVFGLVPAIRAARKNPVDALRIE